MGKHYINELGKTHGMLKVLEFRRLSNGEVAWLCQCACGNQVVVRGTELRKGQQSCGCIKTIHGMADTPIYRQWIAMRSRCKNPNNAAYADYGGRGITVCDRWLEFENFYKDMGDPPDGGSLDRIDVNGNYEPNNCRWATRQQQANNKRNTIYVDVQGKKLTLRDIATTYNLTYKYVFEQYKHNRLNKVLTRSKQNEND